jgi:hypothetical protein
MFLPDILLIPALRVWNLYLQAPNAPQDRSQHPRTPNGHDEKAA